MAAKRGAATPAISVLVVDDHRAFAEALAVALGSAKGLTARIATSGVDAVTVAEQYRPDVILMDLEMPGMSGVEALRKIRGAHPDGRLIALSAYDDDLTRARAVDAGAVAFVSKLTPLEEVATLVRQAGSGDTLMERSEMNRLTRILHHQRRQEATERQRANRLTPRQTQILQMLADGVPMEEIAEQLGVSLYTLRTHVQNILTRLSVHTKVEAVALAIRHGQIAARS